MADWRSWWLAQTPGWGAVKLCQLIKCMGNEQAILELLQICDGPELFWQWIQTAWSEKGEDDTCGKLKIRSSDVARLWEHRNHIETLKEEYIRCMEQGIRFVSISDPEYPQRLLQIFDPPYGLYVRGTLPDEKRKTAAVIGARACSGYGSRQGRRLARELASQGVQIISGMAYGVDSEGHWGALESGVNGSTYAVLGCGVDVCYPAEHEKLAEQIVSQGGGLLSEFPMGTQPSPGQFPMRNRIISGLSDCILVIEARKRSGSLITVDQALEQGREVFALPGRIDDSLSEGCLQLIRNGANILMDSGDVLEYLSIYSNICGVTRREKNINLSKSGDKDIFMGDEEDERKIGKDKNTVYSCLDCNGKTIEEIMEQTGLALDDVRSQLLDLILENQVLETVKGYYSINL